MIYQCNTGDTNQNNDIVNNFELNNYDNNNEEDEYDNDLDFIYLSLDSIELFERDISLIDPIINYTRILKIEEELNYVTNFETDFNTIILNKDNFDINSVAQLMYDIDNTIENDDYVIIHYKNKYFKARETHYESVDYNVFIKYTDNALIELSNIEVPDNVIYVFKYDTNNVKLFNPVIHYSLDISTGGIYTKLVKDLAKELNNKYELYDVLYPSNYKFNYVYDKIYNHPVFRNTIFRLDKLFNLNYEGLYISYNLSCNGLVYKVKNNDDYKKLIRLFNLFYNINRKLE